MRLLRRSAGEIVFLILAGKSAGAKQVLTFLLRRAGGGGRGGGTVVADKGHETRQSAIACARVRARERGREEHVFVAATAAWESRNVMRLTDIKLKYPFWEFAASRVADLPVMFSPALSSFFFFLPPSAVCRQSPLCLDRDVTGGGGEIAFSIVTSSKGQALSCRGEFDLSVSRNIERHARSRHLNETIVETFLRSDFDRLRPRETMARGESGRGREEGRMGGKWVWNVGTIGASFIIIATPSRLVGYAPTVRIYATYNLLHHL